MGVNGHVLPGDLVVTHDYGTQLYRMHPDEISSGPVNLWDDDARLICNLDTDEVCMVLHRAPGSNHGGLAFFVWALRVNRIGLLMNHRVRPHVTQRHVEEAT